MMWLNIVWYALFVIIIAGYLIMDGFDLGVGILHPFLAKNDDERRISLNSIGPVWDGNEVWLVLGGGALFAAFPMVYASLFSGFYAGDDVGAAGVDPAHRRDRVSQQAAVSEMAHRLGLGVLRLVAGHRFVVGRGVRQHHAGRAARCARQHRRHPSRSVEPLCPAGGRDDDLHAGDARRDLPEHEDGWRAADARQTLGSAADDRLLRPQHAVGLLDRVGARRDRRPLSAACRCW